HFALMPGNHLAAIFLAAFVPAIGARAFRIARTRLEIERNPPPPGALAGIFGSPDRGRMTGRKKSSPTARAPAAAKPSVRDNQSIRFADTLRVAFEIASSGLVAARPGR